MSSSLWINEQFGKNILEAMKTTAFIQAHKVSANKE